MLKNIINKKIYVTLLFGAILSTIALLPYALTLQAEALQDLPLPLPVVLTISVLQSSILFAIVTFLGMLLSKKIGLKIPYLEAFFSKNKNEIRSFKPVAVFSIHSGLVVATLILILDLFFTKMGVVLASELFPPAWQAFLASFYGGIAEEILLRLFLMSLFVWIISKTIKTKNITFHSTAIWLAIILSSLFFGLGHLPATAAIITLTPLVVVRALVLNGVGGIVFGWLFWKKGLEAAMISHFVADVMLHVVFVELFYV